MGLRAKNIFSREPCFIRLRISGGSHQGGSTGLQAGESKIAKQSGLSRRAANSGRNDVANGNGKKKTRKRIIWVSVSLGALLLLVLGVMAATRGGTKIDPS